MRIDTSSSLHTTTQILIFDICSRQTNINPIRHSHKLFTLNIERKRFWFTQKKCNAVKRHNGRFTRKWTNKRNLDYYGALPFRYEHEYFDSKRSVVFGPCIGKVRVWTIRCLNRCYQRNCNCLLSSSNGLTEFGHFTNAESIHNISFLPMIYWWFYVQVSIYRLIMQSS